jgi:hypothetical protein
VIQKKFWWRNESPSPFEKSTNFGKIQAKGEGFRVRIVGVTLTSTPCQFSLGIRMGAWYWVNLRAAFVLYVLNI